LRCALGPRATDKPESADGYMGAWMAQQATICMRTDRC
jgi:hypothetical protein